MSHVDPHTFAAFADSQRMRGRDALHVDRCVTCRRAAAQRGISDQAIANAVGAARSRTRTFIATSMLGACIGVAAVAFPLRGAASGFFSIFEPHRIAAVPLTLDDMRSLGRMPDLSAYASTRELRAPAAASFSDVRAATAAAGFPVRQPASVPSGMRALSYLVSGPSAQVLTFRPPAKTATPHVPLPADILGSTLRIDLGATVVTNYETAASAADSQRLGRALERLAASSSATVLRRQTVVLRQPAPAGSSVYAVGEHAEVRLGGGAEVREIQISTNVAPRPPSAAVLAAGAHQMSLPLVVVQMPVPRVASTGVSVRRLASFMLNQPGIPPRVAAAFQALGDLSTTLPIPVPIDKAYTQPVFVDGVLGVGIGDDTGIGAAVIWQKNGMLYAVFAPRTARDVLAIADSLR